MDDCTSDGYAADDCMVDDCALGCSDDDCSKGRVARKSLPLKVVL